MMKKMLLAVIFLVGCGVGVDDPTDESQVQSIDPQTGQHEEALTHNGYCQVFQLIHGIGPWRLNSICASSDGVQCTISTQKAQCPNLAIAGNHNFYQGCGLVDTTRPCSF